MKKAIFTGLGCMLCVFVYAAADTVRLASPDGRTNVAVWYENGLRYSVLHNGGPLLVASEIDMTVLDGGVRKRIGRIRAVSRRKVDERISVPIPEKRRIIANECNELEICCRNSYMIRFRAYDDGVAYRIETGFRDSVLVVGETARFNFPAMSRTYFPRITCRADADIFHTAFEENYPCVRVDSLGPDAFGYLPVLVVPERGARIAVVESDLESYPGMFLKGCGAPSLEGVFAGYPLEWKQTKGEYPDVVVTRRADYIARVKGTRNFPWRIAVVAEEDRDLPGNDLVYRLASPSRIGDTSWLHGIKGTDEWIPDINLYDVPFRAGVNTASYKYYIDFAARFGFSHIMLDAGWSNVTDLNDISPEIDIEEIAGYARQRGVKLCIWTLALELNRNLEKALTQFNDWGIDCIMTDFIHRDDQLAVDFYHRVAAACAKHRIHLMFHGAFPGKGFNRTYPNAVGREGVLGAEYNIWSARATPQHNVTLPFTRMLGGPMDYEPGLLNNATQDGFRAIPGMVMSQGTRCHQLAMFVVYDSSIQLFAGNPSQGMREPEFMEFLAAIPTTWDETLIVDGKIGEYIITVRNNGDEWYVAGMNNWGRRDYNLNLDFLGDGNYVATVCKDGINADRYAADYAFETFDVTKECCLPLSMASGGGFVIRIKKH